MLIAVEKQKVAEKEAETLKKRAVSDAEKDAKVSEILMTQRVREQESIKRQQEIQNEIFLAKERSLTDAAFYRFVGTFNLKYLTGLNTIWKLLFHQWSSRCRFFQSLCLCTYIILFVFLGK